MSMAKSAVIWGDVKNKLFKMSIEKRKKSKKIGKRA